MLPAGHSLKIEQRDNGAVLELTKYWDYQFQDSNVCIDPSEYVEELARLFDQAVNRQLMGDVELGSYLSGGMDSGSISSIASQSISNLKTFTCGLT